MAFKQQPNRMLQLDELNRALLIVGISASLIGMFFKYGTALRYVCTAITAAALIYAAVRIFSGRPEKRNQENLRYLTVTTGLSNFFRNLGDAIRRPFVRNKDSSTVRVKKARNAKKNPTWSELKQFKYFICPQCAQRLRVPRGKGRLRVTCTRCGNVFEVKS